MKSFVTVNSEGYIDMWSDLNLEGFIEVETAENNMNLINVCRIENGTVILDEKRQQEIINNKNAEQTEVELITRDYADLMLYAAEIELQMQQTQQDNADLLLSLAEAGVL
ncbi:hypothetical protein [Listeria monocytogenes]|uniref:hypothetical protein n=1 Tax=Listeria monocytogenes TaxID=1639 RepID=UPI0011EADC8D|nr:hypothetical protein [Listeria monocytogenes]TYV04793.1 hypothetical protein FZ054_10280 [Listeria monocytogenes]